MPKYPKHSTLVPRLKRIEGQVRGITRMVEEGRYCIDIIQQLTAAKKALEQATLQVMRGHIDSCVSSAIVKREGPEKVDELMQAIHRFVR